MRVSLASPLSPAQRSVVPGASRLCYYCYCACLCLAAISSASRRPSNRACEAGARRCRWQHTTRLWWTAKVWQVSGYRRWVVEYIQDAHTAVREAGQQPCTMPMPLCHCCCCARRTRFGAGRVDSLASCLPSPACFPSWQPSTLARIGCHHSALERHPRLWRQATRAACQNTNQADT